MTIQLLLRVVAPGGGHRDLLVEPVFGATVGDLAVGVAAALGDRVRAMFVDGGLVDPAVALHLSPVGNGTVVGWGGPTKASALRPVVVGVVEGPDTGLAVAVDRALTVGRGAENDIDLTDVTVSRRHLSLRPAAGAVEVIDLGGSHVSGEPGEAGAPAPWTAVRPGDRIRMGRTVLAVTEEPVPAGVVWTDGLPDPVVVGRNGTAAITAAVRPAGPPLRFVGEPGPARAAARHAVLQLLSHPSARTVALAVLTSAESGPVWRWTAWLPHTASGGFGDGRAVAGHPVARRALVAAVRRRSVLAPDEPTVVVVDGVDGPEWMPLVGRSGVAVVVVATDSHAPDVTEVEVAGTNVTVGRQRGRAVGCTPATADQAARDEARRHGPTYPLALDDRVGGGPGVGAEDQRLVVGRSGDVPVVIDPWAGPVLVHGRPGAGRSSFLRTLAATVVANSRPDQVRVAVVDPGGRLAALDGLAHLDWRVDHLDRGVLTAAAAHRGTAPRLLLLVDDLDDLHLDDNRLAAGLRDLVATGAVSVVAATSAGDRATSWLAPRTTVVLERPGRGRIDGAPFVVAHHVGARPPAGSSGAVPRVEPLDAVLAGTRSIRPRPVPPVVSPHAGPADAPDAHRGQPALRVVLVTDDDVLAAGATAALARCGCTVVATGVGGDDAAMAASTARVDVAVVDGDGAAGAGPLATLRRLVPDLPAVVICRAATPATATLKLVLGLDPAAVLCAVTDGDELGRAVRAAARGERTYSSGVRERVRAASAFDAMTKAERRLVVELASRPDTRARLARRLHLSISTIDSQLRAVKRKVGEELARTGALPDDGVVSTEAVIGWAIGHGYDDVAMAETVSARA